jgi:hypothetical protein
MLVRLLNLLVDSDTAKVGVVLLQLQPVWGVLAVLLGGVTRGS